LALTVISAPLSSKTLINAGSALSEAAAHINAV